MRAVVIGGGVAGSASAIALARIGAQVNVYEAYEDPAGPVGSYVSVAVNGLRALDALGCLPEVQRAGFPVDRQLMWSGRGKLLGNVARGRRSEDPRHSVTLMRADLVGALREEARRSGARIVTGRRIHGAADPVAGDADLVVGADGIWSVTRRALDPTAPGPAYAKLCHVSGSSDGARLPGISRHGFNWIFARHGVFIYLPAPDGSVWWTAQVAAAQPPADPAAMSAARLAELFRTEEQASRYCGRPPRSAPRPSDTCAPRWPGAMTAGPCWSATPPIRSARARARRWPWRTPWSWPGNWPPRTPRSRAGRLRPATAATGGQAGQDRVRQPRRQDRRPHRDPDARVDHAARLQPLLREGDRLALRLRPRRAPRRVRRRLARMWMIAAAAGESRARSARPGSWAGAVARPAEYSGT